MILKKIKLGLKAIVKIRNWWDFFFDYLGMKKGYVIYKINNKKIKTRASSADKKVIVEIALEEIYFPEWLNDALKENSCVIDVGAHIGVFSVLISSKLSKFSNFSIYSLEPNEENFELLEENAELNKNSRIKPFKIALSDKNMKLKFYKGGKSTRFSLFQRGREEYDLVDSMTLENFLKRENIGNVDLLKVDVEGSEYDIFFATSEKVLRKINNILLEVHISDDEDKTKREEDKIKYNKLLNLFEKSGFKLDTEKEGFIFARR